MNDTMAAAVFQAHARSNATINQNGWKVNTSSPASKRAWMAGILFALATRLAPSISESGRGEVRRTKMPVHA